jgi:putative transcriptional regulator
LTSSTDAVIILHQENAVDYILKNRLKVARAEMNISQEELARLVGVSRQTIGSVETGEYCPSTRLALIMAVKLGKRVEELFYLEEGVV